MHAWLPLMACMFFLIGCQRGTTYAPTMQPSDADREAILGMAGTFKVTFKFEETLALREGYELHKPYEVEAEELVVVAEDRGDYISLQHLLVVRHEGQTHVINHWRQDWTFVDAPQSLHYSYRGDGTWGHGDWPESIRNAGPWEQAVYNVADSPRYASTGRWTHHDGVSRWTGSLTYRPLPLRENHLKDQYQMLASINTHIVTEKGWLHLQENQKRDPSNADEPVLSLERGINRYTRIPDKGFDKAHEYWENTAPFWKEVRSVWVQKLGKRETFRLRDRWKGDPLFSHLNGLADEYWGAAEVSDARPRIQEIIDAFVTE